MPEAKLKTAFTALLLRDLKLAIRRRGELLNPILFLFIVVSLFPLGIGPDPNVLAGIASGVIWVAALLATLLSLDGVFRGDFEDGTLEQLAISPHPLGVLVLAKVLAHWLITGFPLILVSPLLAGLLNLDGESTVVLLESLALGTPFLSLIGTIGIALTVGLRRGGMLLTLLILPLYVPVLIFATGAVDAAASGFSPAGHLMMLAALLLGAISLAPLAAGAALRISIE